ncbi:MAG TPA: sugar-binding protein [Polyangia bacterium]|nr:sugar-binding protein [Polyangia bacterium]
MRKPTFGLLALVGLAACAGAPADVAHTAAPLAAINLGVTDATEKVRPDFVVPAAATANVEAARNEFEPFQIVLGGGASGLAGVTASAGALTGPSGAQLPASGVRLYRVDLYHVEYASNAEGAAGEWPDPLVPDVDAYFGEQRNAFPFDVPAGESRAIWVELYVPPGTPAGMYSGAVTVQASGVAPASVSVSLRVRGFDLPSTATLKSAFGFSVDMACRAHRGVQWCNSDADAEPWIKAYGRAALDHRISFWNPYYVFPSSGDFSYFDTVPGALIGGTMSTLMSGASMTTTAVGTTNPSGMAAAASHFAAKGWKGLFQYTCDEPPATCAFSDIPVRAQAAHNAGVRTLVTTNYDNLVQYGLLDAVDIVVPVIDQMQPPSSADASDARADYDAFLQRGPSKEIWIYQSCDQHGCHAAGSCDASQASDPQVGWPSYMVDASALQNRAMEWLSYRFRVSGELYYETVQHLDDAWNSHVAGHDAFCDFGGNGDGALFYPGTPARIGGTTDIPVESQRLKMIREGMEDYEYLHLLDSLGGAAQARAAVDGLFPAAFKVTQGSPAALYAARSAIADQIEQRLGTAPTIAPLGVARAPAPIDVHGDPAAFSTGTAVTVSAGDAQATFRLLWDETALYVAADVTDPLLRVIGTGRDGELWNADGVELLIDPLHDRSPAPDADDRHVIVTAAGDLLDARGAGAGEDRSVTLGVDYAVTANGVVNGGQPSQGYRVAMAIPWSALGVTPNAGRTLGLDLALNDLGASALASRDWAGASPFAQPSRWNAVQLDAAGGNLPQGGRDGEHKAVGGGAVTPQRFGCATIPGASSSDLALAFALAAFALLRSRSRSRSRSR